MKCLILDIWQSSDNALISEYSRVLNIPGLWICQGYTRFWIKYLLIDIWHYSIHVLDSEYATVLKMLRLHKVVNKIFHHTFWQGSEYASSSEYTSVTQGSVENSPPHMFKRFLSVSWALSMLGLEYTRVMNILTFHMVLCFKNSQYFDCLEFWIC